MARFLMLSVLIVTIAIPMRTAKIRNARAGLQRVVLGMTIYLFAWVFFLVYIFLRIDHG